MRLDIEGETVMMVVVVVEVVGGGEDRCDEGGEGR